MVLPEPKKNRPRTVAILPRQRRGNSPEIVPTAWVSGTYAFLQTTTTYSRNCSPIHSE
jgi:hypothetical protein